MDALLKSDTASQGHELSSETNAALQHALMQAQGVEWGSQPFSSMQHEDYVDLLENPADDSNSCAIPAIPKGQRTEIAEPQPQHAPAKVSLLTRPTSSGEDLAAGFSFGKAPPMKADLTRKRKPENAETIPTENQQCRSVHPQPSHHGSPPSEQRDSIDALAGAAINQSNSVQRDAVPLKLPGLPFPVAATRSSPKPNHPTSATSGESHAQRPLPAAPTSPTENEISMSADDTLVDTNTHVTTSSHAQGGSAPGAEQLTDAPLSAGRILDNPSIHSHHKQRDMTNGTERTPQQGTEARPRPRVRKTRKKAQSSMLNKGPANSHEPPPSEEQLLTLLLYRRKEEGLERERMQGVLRAKEAELQQAVQVNEELYAHLQDVSQHVSEKDAQLSRIQASKSGWESKLKKLGDYVKGLTNDHNKLRDDAKAVREQQASVLKEKDELIDTLREVYQTTQKGNAKSNQLVTEARHELKMLEQKMEHQQLKLREEEALLVSERQRNSHLEGQISAFAASHAQLQNSFATHREAITVKIDDLLSETSEHFRATASESSQDNLRPMLEQCVELLKALPKTDGGVKPADFQKLENSMRGYFDGIARSVEACDHNTSVMESGHQQLALSVRKELQALGSNIITEHTLSEQIIELREMRATVRERLHSTETALRDSRLEVVALQQKEAEHLRRMTLLENDRCSRQPAEDPQVLLRLQETDSLNKDLQRDLATQSAETNLLGEQLHQKDEELHQLQDRMTQTETLLDEARQQTASIKLEKLNLGKQSVLEREELRIQLSKAASLELGNLKSEHLNSMHQLKAKVASTDEKYRQAEDQLTATREGREQVEREAATMRKTLEAVQKERENETERANDLHRHVAELEKQAQGMETAYKSLVQELQDERADNQAKDSYLKAALAHVEKKKADQSHSVRGSDLSMALRPHLPTVVEDSQPTGKPRFASHEDIMGIGDQGFEPGEMLDGNQGSQISEDYSGLFPGTPKHSRTIEVTNVSYSRSRVSSREADTPHRQKMLSGSAHQPPQQTVSRPKESVQANKPSATSRRPHPDLPASSGTMKSPTESSQSQRPTKETSGVPRGILKPASQDSKGQKRPAAEQGIASAAGFTATKRRKSSSTTNGLGPVIADSQSPAKNMGGRGRKQTTRHGAKSKKDEHFLQTFKGYTGNGHPEGSQ